MPFCNACGKEYKPGVGDGYCANCGAPLPSFALPPTAPPASERITLRRLVAGAVDVAVLLVITGSLLLSRRFALALFIQRKLRLLLIPLPGALLAMKDSLSGKSIGKLVTGLMVFNEKEQKPAGPLDSFLRSWFFIIPFVGWVLALIVAVQILLGKKRRLGDVLANTLVISDAEYQRRR